jgi:hypothetical protein
MITAKHKYTDKVVDLDYKTIEEAKFRNPFLKDFRFTLDFKSIAKNERLKLNKKLNYIGGIKG